MPRNRQHGSSSFSIAVRAPNTSSVHTVRPQRAMTPEPSSVLYSDITQRYCDKKLMDMQEKALALLESRGKRAPAQRTTSLQKLPSPNARASLGNAIGVVAQTDEVALSGAEASVTTNPPQEAQNPVVDVLVSSGSAAPEANVVEGAEMATPKPHDIPTGGELVVATKKSGRAAPNPTLPCELLPVLLPGVSSSLLQAASRRYKRAERRRKDYLRIQKNDRKIAINEDELFPPPPVPLVSDDEEEDTNDQPPVAHETGNEQLGGVETPRELSTTDQEHISSHPPADIVVVSSPVRFSPERARTSFGCSPPRLASPSPDEHLHRRALRLHSLPQTAAYQHLIRMHRIQQREWKPMPRNWDADVQHHRAGLHTQHDYCSEQLSGVYSDNLSESVEVLRPSQQVLPSQQVPTVVPMLSLPKAHVLMPLAKDTAMKPFSTVPALNLQFKGVGTGDGSAVGLSTRAPASESEYGSQPQSRRRGGGQQETWSCHSCSNEEDENPEPPRLLRRGLSTDATEYEATAACSLADEGGGHRPQPPRDDLSSDEDENEEDVDALRQQFADFLQRRTHGDDGGEAEADAPALPKTKAFVLPQTFVKYSLTNIRSSTTAFSPKHIHGRKPKLRRMDSLIDDSDRSTPYFAPTVKIVWGSVPSNVEPSAVARTAPCRLVVELMFRPGYHHFDARHLYSLMHPFTEYVLDLEAGNRGGKFIAIYSTSELQGLKVIAAMMSKVRRGESYMLMDCFCAPSPNHAHKMLVESPRDCDQVGMAGEKLRVRDKDSLPGVRDGVFVVSEDGGEEELSEGVPDPMSWFKKFAVAIDNKVVNHHAPGALEQYMAIVEKRRRQKVVQQKRKKKRKSIFGAVATAHASAAGQSPQRTAAEILAEEGALDEADDEDPTLFIAEGDEVTGLENLPLPIIPDEDEDAQMDEPLPGNDDPDEPMERRQSVKKQVSIFSLKEMNDNELHEALERDVSIMELIARSKYSPEELRRMRSRKDVKRSLSRAQLLKLERLQQSGTKSMKDFRSSRAAAMLEAAETSSTGSRRSVRKKIHRRNAKALHAKRKQKLAEEEAEKDNNPPTQMATLTTALESSGRSHSVVILDNNEQNDGSDGVDAVAVDPSTLGPAPLEGTPVSQPERIAIGEHDLEAVEAKAVEPGPNLQELDDAEALGYFAEFLHQYATSEKVAVVVPVAKFEDPSIPPISNAESDAEDLIFLLHQLDYDIVVMVPPTAAMHPGPDATDEERALYEEQVEIDRKRWFLTPTAENIYEVTEALLRQNQGGRYCCVGLFLLTRGFIGGLSPKLTPPATRSEQLIALTMDVDLLNMTHENTINPRELMHKMKRATGKVPMVFVDTYPLPDIPNSDAYGNFITIARTGQSGPETLQRAPAPAFLCFSAQPEDGGHELLCQYPKFAGGLGLYYFKRALEGRACPPKSLVMTMSNMIFYLSAKLQKRGCKVHHNAVVPKGYSALRPYFDLSIVYDSAYEMHRNLDAAHVVEITSSVRLNMRCRVQLDQTMYLSESDAFLHAPEAWTKQLRRDLHKILYPKKHDAPAPVPTRVKGKLAPVVAIKPRPEKALRLKPLLCRPVNSTLVIQYNDCAELLHDEKKFRPIEKDVARIGDTCEAIQREEPHGFIFANGLNLLSPAQRSALEVHGATGRPADMVRRSKAQQQQGVVGSKAPQPDAPLFDPSRFNRIDINLRLMQVYLTPSGAASNRTNSIPVGLHPYLTAGTVQLQFYGPRKRVQQDFAMNYFITGCQRTTIQGTTPVSLFKRPTMLWGEIDLVFSGNRRDHRKLDRLMRQQALRPRGGDSIELTSVELDLFELYEHAAAIMVQRRFRGHLVRKVLASQRKQICQEAMERAEVLEDEATLWHNILLAFFGIYKRLLESFEDYNRVETFFEEQENRWYLILEARRLLEAAFHRGRSRLIFEEASNALPLLASVGDMRIQATEAFEWAWLLAHHWFLHGVAWDRYYLEMDCLQEILRARNLFRDENQLEHYQLGYLMEHPIPPSTDLDTGRSIIRTIVEEKSRKVRKEMRERALKGALAALRRQKEAETEETSHAAVESVQ